MAPTWRGAVVVTMLVLCQPSLAEPSRGTDRPSAHMHPQSVNHCVSYVTHDSSPLLSATGAIGFLTLGSAHAPGSATSSSPLASPSSAPSSETRLMLDIVLNRKQQRQHQQKQHQQRALYFAADPAAGHNVRVWVSRSVPTSCPPGSALQPPWEPLKLSANCAGRQDTLRLEVPAEAFNCSRGVAGDQAVAELHTVFFLTLQADLATEPCSPPTLSAYAGPAHDAVSPGSSCTFVTVTATCKPPTCDPPQPPLVPQHLLLAGTPNGQRKVLRPHHRSSNHNTTFHHHLSPPPPPLASTRRRGPIAKDAAAGGAGGLGGHAPHAPGYADLVPEASVKGLQLELQEEVEERKEGDGGKAEEGDGAEEEPYSEQAGEAKEEAQEETEGEEGPGVALAGSQAEAQTEAETQAGAAPEAAPEAAPDAAHRAEADVSWQGSEAAAAPAIPFAGWDEVDWGDEEEHAVAAAVGVRGTRAAARRRWREAGLYDEHGEEDGGGAEVGGSYQRWRRVQETVWAPARYFDAYELRQALAAALLAVCWWRLAAGAVGTALLAVAAGQGLGFLLKLSSRRDEARRQRRWERVELQQQEQEQHLWDVARLQLLLQQQYAEHYGWEPQQAGAAAAVAAAGAHRRDEPLARRLPVLPRIRTHPRPLESEVQSSPRRRSRSSSSFRGRARSRARSTDTEGRRSLTAPCSPVRSGAASPRGSTDGSGGSNFPLQRHEWAAFQRAAAAAALAASILVGRRRRDQVVPGADSCPASQLGWCRVAATATAAPSAASATAAAAARPAPPATRPALGGHGVEYADTPIARHGATARECLKYVGTHSGSRGNQLTGTTTASPPSAYQQQQDGDEVQGDQNASAAAAVVVYDPPVELHHAPRHRRADESSGLHLAVAGRSRRGLIARSVSSSSAVAAAVAGLTASAPATPWRSRGGSAGLGGFTAAGEVGAYPIKIQGDEEREDLEEGEEDSYAPPNMTQRGWQPRMVLLRPPPSPPPPTPMAGIKAEWERVEHI